MYSVTYDLTGVTWQTHKQHLSRTKAKLRFKESAVASKSQSIWFSCRFWVVWKKFSCGTAPNLVMMMKTRVQLSLLVFAMFFSRSFLPSKEKQRLLVDVYIQLNVKTKNDVCFQKFTSFFEFHSCTRSTNDLR